MKEFFKLIKDMFYRFNDDDVTTLSAFVSYSLLSAFFPFMIFLLTLAGYSALKSEDVLSLLSNVLPSDAFGMVTKTVKEVIDKKNGSLMSVSLIFAAWSATSGFGAVMKGLNKAYDETETRGFFKLIFIKIVSTLGLSVIIIFSLVLLVLGDVFQNFLHCCFKASIYYRTFWTFLRYIVTVGSVLITFLLMYYYIPCRRLKWREVIPGALFSTSSWIISSIIFSYYVNNYGNYSQFYGSIGAIFIFITWLYISSIIILTGGELNAALVKNNKYIF